MYRCFNSKKFLRLFITDLAVIISLIFFTKYSGIDWSALEYDNREGIFMPVIMYHSIVDDVSRVNEYVVTPETIEKDMKYLKDNGYETVLTDDLINYIENDVPLPQKPVMITLDDGFYNNAYYLVPLLEKYDMKAVISIVGEYCDSASERDAHIPEYSYLTWEDISDISENPRIEIGNHTYSMHTNNSRKGCSKLLYETEEEYSEILFEDISKLQNKLSSEADLFPISFAYPFGYISRESIPVLKDLGIKATFTCYEKPNYIIKNPQCLYGLDRYNRDGNISTEAFMEKALNEY